LLLLVVWTIRLRMKGCRVKCCYVFRARRFRVDVRSYWLGNADDRLETGDYILNLHVRRRVCTGALGSQDDRHRARRTVPKRGKHSLQ
jgi:hypothetical protein